MRNIVITGFCEYESLGIRLLLEAEEYAVHELTKMKPGRDDLLIVGLSALPELGWWRWLDLLGKSKDLYRCRIIAVVPGTLKQALSVLISGDREVIAGDESLSVFRHRLISAISRWQGAQQVRENKVSPLSVSMIDALYTVIVGGDLNISKAQYTCRYQALSRLKFSGTMQFRRFMAG
ncbi:hypothetical protein F9N64_19735 [Salmonella enterica]|nr:hypothetical protein [Salmonella enterica subsp. salamae]EGU9002796.1 hypothetical protein [Salmonella enterica]